MPPRERAALPAFPDMINVKLKVIIGQPLTTARRQLGEVEFVWNQAQNTFDFNVFRGFVITKLNTIEEGLLNDGQFIYFKKATSQKLKELDALSQDNFQDLFNTKWRNSHVWTRSGNIDVPNQNTGGVVFEIYCYKAAAPRNNIRRAARESINQNASLIREMIAGENDMEITDRQVDHWARMRATTIATNPPTSDLKRKFKEIIVGIQVKEQLKFDLTQEINGFQFKLTFLLCGLLLGFRIEICLMHNYLMVFKLL
jgi:hypothetical protein